MELSTARTNPTMDIDVSFAAYVQNRTMAAKEHMKDGVPDYAYGMDMSLRKKLRAIPGLYAFCKALVSYTVPIEKQKQLVSSLKVGPSQFPEIYQMGVDCARLLGIGIPTIYITDNSVMNAWTYASEDDAPMIVLTSALTERLTNGELKAIIGHECGHIHNNHGIYNMAATLLTGGAGTFAGILNIPVVTQIMSYASLPIQFALLAWSRAGEVTCDRAGVICADDMNDALTAEAKFVYGAMFGRNDVNIESLLKQYEAIKSTPYRLEELFSTHPKSVRRVFAVKEFMNSEMLYKWRPEWKDAGMEPLNEHELEARTKNIVNVIQRGGRKRKHDGK